MILPGKVIIIKYFMIGFLSYIFIGLMVNADKLSVNEESYTYDRF